MNTAVDLIVAHFGTSRDPDVKVSDFGAQTCSSKADIHTNNSFLLLQCEEYDFTDNWHRLIPSFDFYHPTTEDVISLCLC